MRTTTDGSEKNTNWEGAFRIPELIRWPGWIPAGVGWNEIVQHHDWLPTLLAAAGDPDIAEKLKAGHQVGETTYKVHIDGYNLLPYLTGETDTCPRKGLIYLPTTATFSESGWTTGKSCSWNSVPKAPADLGGTVRAATPPQAVQLRTDPFERGRHHLEHVLRLAC
jgi:arylsulfatase A-like enzyme